MGRISDQITNSLHQICKIGAISYQWYRHQGELVEVGLASPPFLPVHPDLPALTRVLELRGTELKL